MSGTRRAALVAGTVLALVAGTVAAVSSCRRRRGGAGPRGGAPEVRADGGAGPEGGGIPRPDRPLCRRLDRAGADDVAAVRVPPRRRGARRVRVASFPGRRPALHGR